MVSSAIFGAAAGTGLALVVAMTIVVYRYYAVKRKGKYWSSLDRWPDPPGTKKGEGRQEQCSEHCHDSSSSHVLNCWRKQQKNYYAVQSRGTGNGASSSSHSSMSNSTFTLPTGQPDHHPLALATIHESPFSGIRTLA